MRRDPVRGAAQSAPSLPLAAVVVAAVAGAAIAMAAVAIAAVAPAGAGTAPASASYQGPGTKKMAARLLELERNSDPMENPWGGAGRVEMVRAKLQGLSDPKQYLRLQSQLCTELLNAGKSMEAIEELTALQKFVSEQKVDLSAPDRQYLSTMTALAHLRLGEQENCLARHSTESCLLPIRGSGIHTLDRGSRGAIRVLTERLTATPDDLEARWLLNVAAMTVGDWPDKVPAPWLIPPAAFKSETEVKPFTDVAPRLGLDLDGLAGGSVVDDLDNDGDLDIVVTRWNLGGQMRYFRNESDGSFVERTREAGFVGETGGLNLVQTDYDNDGNLDLLVERGGWLGKAGRHPLSLLRNGGDGTFDDVTEQAGLLRFHPTQTAVWLDYNNDGWLDFFVGNESTGQEVHPCELFRNNGDGTFTETAASAGVATVAWVKGVTAGDYNNDGRMDLYLSIRGQANQLFRNDGPQDPKGPANGPWRFTEVAASAHVTEPIMSFPTWFFDYDNDGWLDLFVSGYQTRNVGDIAADYLGLPTQAERARLYHNNRDGTFSDVSRAAGVFKVVITMGSNYGDIDNDGWLDFYLGTGDPLLTSIVPNRMFRNDGGRRFQDVTTSARVGHLQKGHAVSFADIDHDGDEDIFEVVGGAVFGDNYRSVLYENPGYGNHWIVLKLEGVKTNRAAIGARIKVVVQEGGKERAIHRVAGTGGSFGANPLRQEIGLGQATSVSRVEIVWPTSGTTQVLKGLALDHRYRVREGDAQAIPLTVKRFDLSPDRPAAGNAAAVTRPVRRHPP
ncbi:MAG TPA: CRTAC1 family protein [Candidatus Cryosericum sp.]|nr:CRTAC1 family protein [Candidatus Cryosericum sp.]